jgi:small subunit ribosomal protein S16
MPLRIRLQRFGKKGKPYFHIVAADSRSRRDGRFVERLGNYNPNTNPATIELDVDKAVQWLRNGAEPSDTARAILSYKGALYKNHLLKGVEKGAFSEEEATRRFDAWLEQKEGKVQGKIQRLQSESDKDRRDRLAAEKEVNQKRAASLAAAQASAVADETEEAASEAGEENAPAEEGSAEA